MKDIIEFIKDEMEARGITYGLLSKKYGTPRQNLWMKLNKNTRPNFETVVKILKVLDYDITIEKIKEIPVSEQELTQKFLESAEEEQVGFDCVEKMLAATGYALKITTHKDEQKVKKGVDNY